MSAITICRIEDSGLIKSAMNHPRVYPHIIDDGCIGIEIDVNPALLYLGAFDGDEFLGLFLVNRHNFVCFEVHTCLLPASWGDRAHHAARALIAWVFEKTECKRLITNVPQSNALALKFAESAGMVQFGINEGSFQRNGAIESQILLGISKEL